MSKNRLILIVLGVGLALAVVGLGLGSEPAGTAGTTGTTASPAAPSPPAAAAAPSSAPLPTRTEAAPPPAVTDPVLAALEPNTAQLHCAVTGLADGAWWARPAQLRLAVVSGGVLTAVVDARAGEVWLEQELHPAGQLKWDDQRCSFTPVQMTTVAGTLHHADGRPAVDVAVRGCLHGEFARTDTEGRWTMPAPVGRQCHPMAFVEASDGRFGKSNVQTIRVEGPTTGIALQLPPDEALLDHAAQLDMATRAARMFGVMMGPDKQRLHEWEQGAAGLSAEQGAAVEARMAHQRDLVERSEREQQRLLDPEDAPQALKEAWLNLN